MNFRQFCIPPALWQRLQQLLFTGDHTENFCFGLVKPFRRRSGLAYLVEEILPCARLDYEGRSGGGLTMTRSASNRLNVMARDAAELGLIPVHFHSHPPGCANFSGYDDLHEAKLHQWLRTVNQPLLISVVIPYSGQPVARLWVEGEVEHLPIRVGLQPIVGFAHSNNKALARQSAFGSGLSAAAANMSVAIVGTGGIGMLVAEQLVRCGFRSFVLVDPDIVESTNLNRLNSAFSSDIGKKKVVAAARLIKNCAAALGIDAEVAPFPEDIYNARNRVQEMVRQCDLVLALTDDQLSRIHTLTLAMDGGAEFLSAGVDIRIGDDGDVEGLYAEILGGERNRFCPVCAGRLDPAEAAIEARRYVGGIVAEHAKRAGYLPDIPAPAVMSLNSTAAGMLVLEIQRRVSGLGRRDLIHVDWQSGAVRAIERGDVQLSNSCSFCGRSTKTQREILDRMYGSDDTGIAE
jgi:hypothetical protein